MTDQARHVSASPDDQPPLVGGTGVKSERSESRATPKVLLTAETETKPSNSGEAETPTTDRRRIMDKFWTTEEVATMLRVNGSTVRRWRLDDVGPRFVKIGNVYRYPDSVLQEWLRQRIESRRAA